MMLATRSAKSPTAPNAPQFLFAGSEINRLKIIVHRLQMKVRVRYARNELIFPYFLIMQSVVNCLGQKSQFRKSQFQDILFKTCSVGAISKVSSFRGEYKQKQHVCNHDLPPLRDTRLQRISTHGIDVWLKKNEIKSSLCIGLQLPWK